MWAREKIRLLSDYAYLDDNAMSFSSDNNTLKEEITALGLKYNLLTEYTSFIAIDSLVSNKGGEQTSINQALPLPKGVSSSAILSVAEERESAGKEIYITVEAMPEFPGGIPALKQYLGENIQYPPSAAANSIEGTVFIEFVVDTNGSIINVKVLRSVDPDLDAEAIRVVKAMPKWKPGEQQGKKVRTTYVLPISFRLTRDEQ